MGTLFKNRYIDAITKTVMVYAFIHGLTMSYYFMFTGDYHVFSGFRILGIDLFFPNLTNGLVNFILGAVLLLVIFMCIYFGLTKRRKATLD